MSERIKRCRSIFREDRAILVSKYLLPKTFCWHARQNLIFSGLSRFGSPKFKYSEIIQLHTTARESKSIGGGGWPEIRCEAHGIATAVQKAVSHTPAAENRQIYGDLRGRGPISLPPLARFRRSSAADNNILCTSRRLLIKPQQHRALISGA